MTRALTRRRHRGRAGLLLAALFAVTCAAGVVTAGPAAAHTSVVEVRPADGAALERPAQQVQLVFDHPVRGPVTVVVAGPDGRPVTLGSARLEGRVVTQPLQGTAAAGVLAGRYRIGYRVVGDDGHPVVGQAAFVVGRGAGAADDGASGPDRDRPALWAGAALLLAGLLLTARRSRAGRSGGPGRAGDAGPGVGVAAGPAAVVLGVLVVALAAGGGAPVPAPAGLPDPGPVTGWGLPLLRWLTEAALVLAVGAALLPAGLLPGARPPAAGPAAGSATGSATGSVPDPLRRRALRLASGAALGAAAAGLLQAVLSRSEVYALAPWAAAAPADLLGYLATDRQGLALGAQLLLAVLAASAARRGAAGPAVTLAAVALLPPVLTGHGVGLGAPGLSGTLVGVHVLGAAGWVGGLLAVGWLARSYPDRLAGALPRFSVLATGCLVLVASTGLLTGLLRIGPDGWSTGYAALVLVKLVLLLAVAEAGRRNRAAVQAGVQAGVQLPAQGRSRPGGLLRLAGVELLLMAAASAVAVALTRTPLPAREFTPPVDGADLLGYLPPYQATVARLLTGRLADGPALLLLAVLTAGYLAGVLAVRRRGGRWPVAATAAWTAGLLLLGWATVGGLGVYARVNLPGHVAARLLLATAVPILLLRGAPAALAEAAWDLRPSAALVRRWRTLAAPEVALPAFALAVFGWYLPGVLSPVMLRPGGYWLMAAAALVAGLLAFSRAVPPAAGGWQQPSVVEQAAAPLGVLAMCAGASLVLTWVRLDIGLTYFRQLTVPYFRVLPEEQRFAGTAAWLAGGVPVLVLLVVLVLAGRGGPAETAGPAPGRSAGSGAGDRRRNGVDVPPNPR